MKRLGWSCLALVLGGCSPRVSLPEVPIIGGTPQARAEARAELLDFDRWVGPGRLQISQVRFTELDPSIMGEFHRLTYRIDIAEDWPASVVRDALRHELCHALDYTDDLVDTPLPLFDELAAGLLAPDAGVFLYEPVTMDYSARRQRSEALAQYCTLGPSSAQALSRPCPGDPALGNEVGQWLTQHVWKDGHLPTIRLPDTGTRVQVPELPHTTFYVHPYKDNKLLVWWSEENGVTERAYDLYTGEELPLDALSNQEPDPSEVTPNLPPEYTFFHVNPQEGAEGEGAALFHVDLRHLDHSAWRTAWSDGTAWHLVEDTCGPQGEWRDTFTANGRPWVAWTIDGWLHWAPLDQSGIR